MDKKYSPTEAELKVINEKFAKEDYKSVDDLYVFPAMVVDNLMTAYYTRLHPDFLKQAVKDLAKGVVFLVGHDKTKLPMAKSFKGTSTNEGEVMEVYAKFFMQKDLKVNELNTDDFMKAYLGGTLEDVSIGFAAKSWICSICDNDIRSGECKHWPGLSYNDKDEEVKKGGTQCFVWVKEPAGPTGEALLEVSACYKGAVPNAKLKKPEEAPQFTIELTAGKNLKEMSIDAPIAVNFSIPISEEYERGKGRGKGGPRQGDGGAKYCKCPKCGYTVDHARGKPCQEIPCAKCGAKMVGTDKKNSMELLDCNKLVDSGYKEEDLKDFELSAANIDTVLHKEVSEQEGKTLKELAVKNKVDLGEYLKKFPAFELLHSEKEYPRLTRDYVTALPDDSFAAKGENGRYFPHHNKKGILGPLHLEAALARVSQVKNDDIRGVASAHLEQHKLDLEKEAIIDQIKELQAKVETSDTNSKVAVGKVTKLEKDNEELVEKLKKTEEANLKLQKEKQDLEPKAKEGEEYRKDLAKEILELGVKLNGNAFDKGAHEKTLKDMSLEDMKKMKVQLWTQLCDKLPAVKNALGPEASLSNKKQESVPDSAFKVN